MNLLSIGGSDPSSGAGIQSDIKAFAELGAHGLTVVTAVTSQNTTSFGMVESVSQKILKNQIESVLSDFTIDGIKIGMVFNSRTIKTIYRQLCGLGVPIVVDPVIISTTGGTLLERSAIADFQRYLVPLATVITPNMSEAATLAGMRASSNIEKVALAIQKMGARNVIITGIKRDNKISDFVLSENTKYFVAGDKITSTNHGSGCNYSAAMTFAISDGRTIRQSVKFSKEFATNSIRNAKNIGKGIKITNVKDSTISELSQAIDEFVEIRDIHKNIPECQTNFVYSKLRPKSTRDILGLSGRIVKVGKTVTVAGSLTYGGSEHVAAALLSVNKKFPKVCSAINLKYHDAIISKATRLDFIVSSYDRHKEPSEIKRHDSTIKWGIQNAIKDSRIPPDVIYHRGDFGKEPMIIVFGDTPQNVLKKILKII